MGVKLRWIRNAWYVVYNRPGEKRKSVRIGPDRKEAEAWAAKMEAALKAEALSRQHLEQILAERYLDDIPTLGKYGRKWIQEINLSILKDSTKLRYYQAFRDHIEPCGIARKKIDNITYATIKEFILELKGRMCLSRHTLLSRNSIRNVLAVLRLILSEAEAEGLIKGNPAANKKLAQFYREAAKHEEIHPFTLEEVHQVEELIRQRWPWYYALVVCLFRTGIRAGEARGLEWGDVNLRARKLTIRRSWTYGREKASPKTAASRRTVDLSGDLVEVLQDWKAYLKEYWLQKGIQDPGLVFPSVNGLSVDLRNFQRWCWVRAQEELGLDVRRIHDTRHTFATILLAKGVPITRVAHLLGHASVRTTLQFYAHYLPSETDPGDISAAMDTEVKMRAKCEQSASREKK